MVCSMSNMYSRPRDEINKDEMWEEKNVSKVGIDEIATKSGNR